MAPVALVDPISNQVMLEKVIPTPGVIEGDPQIYLVEDGGKKYLFHKTNLLNNFLKKLEIRTVMSTKAESISL